MSSRFALRLVADRLQKVCHVGKDALWWQHGVANGIARTLVMTPTCGMNPLIASCALPSALIVLDFMLTFCTRLAMLQAMSFHNTPFTKGNWQEFHVLHLIKVPKPFRKTVVQITLVRNQESASIRCLFLSNFPQIITMERLLE